MYEATNNRFFVQFSLELHAHGRLGCFHLLDDCTTPLHCTGLKQSCRYPLRDTARIRIVGLIVADGSAEVESHAPKVALNEDVDTHAGTARGYAGSLSFSTAAARSRSVIRRHPRAL